jgi:pimeloyl-ACP methyl ester carboxylesterase
MQQRIGDVVLSYAEHGRGEPLVALHGAGVDHRDVESAVEALVPEGYRRIYLDLPGMGCSTAGGLTSNDDVVTVLAAFVEQLGAGPVRLLGHSYGAYLARGLAVRRPDLLRGLALLCPVGDGSDAVPEPVVVRQDPDAYDELEPGQRAGFDEYFVVRTRRTARRYRDAVLPGTRLADQAALERIFARWTIELGPHRFPGPTLVVAGRQDSTAGAAHAAELAADHPHCTLAVLDGAGHALMHERPELLGALLRDWLSWPPGPA